MSEKLKESLSAVIDGEADEFELRRVLDEIGKDAKLALSWERYHLIGSAMRRERVVNSSIMREQVWAEVRPESATSEARVQVAAEPDTAKPLGEPAVGRRIALTVAAGLLVVAILGLGDFAGIGEGSPPVVAGSERPAEPSTAQLPSPNGTLALYEEVTDTDQNRVRAYMVSHHQQLGMNRPGFSGFAKMVAYEKD